MSHANVHRQLEAHFKVTDDALNMDSNSITNVATISGSPVISGTLDLNGNSLVLDADADTSIVASTDDQIDVTVNGSVDIRITENLTTFLTGRVQVNDDVYFSVGTGDDANFLWSTADASNHAAVLALGNSSQALHITDYAASATDWNVSADTHPTLYVHSNTTPATDYLRIGDHDGTEADIDVVGGTSLSLKLAGTEYASVRVTGLASGTYVAASTAGTDQVTIKSTGTAPSGTGANVGHLYADFETDDDELFWLSGTGGTATQLTT